MSLTSFYFFVFVLFVLTVYFIIPIKYRWLSLLICSYIFYAFAGIEYVIFLLFTTITTYITGVQLNRYNIDLDNAIKRSKSNNKNNIKLLYKKKNKKILLPGLIINLSVLVVFKYTNDFISYINSFVKIFKVDVVVNPITLLVPLGLSYYIFQSVGYIIDLYRNKYRAEKNFFRYALFISYFPQIIQGPISRYDELSKQLFIGHSFDSVRIKNGAVLMLWGLFKKLVIADRLGLLVNAIFNNYPEYLGSYIIVGGVLYSFQVYGDFSGGIDIARGVSEMLGIILPQNFQRPFFATSLQEYWRRWHISLNNWLRDYIFYPISLSKTFVKLGKKCRSLLGQRIGKNLAIYIATLIVRLIMAIWHGMSLKYIVQGLFHGLLIICGIHFAPELKLLTNKLKIRTNCFSWKLYQIIRTFILAGIARIIVRADNITVAWEMLKSTITVYNPWILVDGSLFRLGLSAADFMLVIFALLVLFCVSLCQECGIHIRESLNKQNIVFQWIIIYGLFICIVIFGIYGSGYDASSFIYQQF